LLSRARIADSLDVDQLRAILKEPVGEQHVPGAAHQTINTAADSEMGITNAIAAIRDR
jgi:hypothetical protein